MDYPTSETNYTSTKLLLPLFLTSRNRIRLNRFWEVRHYIAKKAKSYAKCVERKLEDDEDDETNMMNNGKVGKTNAGPLRISGKPPKEISWKMAPNRYNVLGHTKSCMKGAFWSKLKRVPLGGKPVKGKGVTAFYEIPRDSEKHIRRCHWYKGKFTTDPRKRRPTSRFMVSNIFTCWRNPKDPGPTKYFRGIFAKERFAKIKHKPLVPYKFLRYSCVPEKKNAAYAKKSSFFPGPGRYELADDEDCLRISLNIEKQKRYKFRRLPYKRIYIGKQLQGFLWRHIYGFGFTRLFKGPLLRPAVIVTKKKTRKVEREVNMFHSFEYRRMISNPERVVFSIRTEEIRRKIRPMRYNCLVRVIIRRQLRNNKKIAFNSGMPRFPDSDMPTARKTAKPPPLVDHPVTRVPLSEIKSNLHAVPKRLMGIFKENRMRPFKFQPFPPVKLLLDENEVHPDCADTAEMYPRKLNPLDFYKDEFIRK